MEELRRRDKIFAGAVLLVVVGMAVVQYKGGALGDKDWLLMAARMWVSGKRLFVDIFEVNPPLIIWIYSIPVSLSLLLPVDDPHVLVLLGIMLVLISTALVWRVTQSYNVKERGIISLLTLFVLLVWPNPFYFADREHIFIVLVLPYCMRWMPSLAQQEYPRWVRVAIAVAAGVGFCIKPHCALLFIAVQLSFMLDRRNASILISIENIGIYAVGMLYLAAIWLATPEYFQLVLPMAMVTYGAYKADISHYLYYMPPLLMLAVGISDFRLHQRSAHVKDVHYWLMVVMAALFYAAANNGWIYSFYPLHAMVLMAVGWLWMHYSRLAADAEYDSAAGKAGIFGARSCMLVFVANTLFILPYIIVLAAPKVATMGPGKPSGAAICVAELSETLRDGGFQSFGAISLSADVWPGLVRRTGARLDTRFENLWMLPRFMREQGFVTEGNKWVISYVSNALSADLEHNKPPVLLVEQTGNLANKLELIDYLMQFPVFSQSWSAYLPVIKQQGQKNGSGCNYRVFIRRN